MSQSSPQSRVAIVGAGLSGLACARELKLRGISCTLFDRGRSLGGRLSTREVRVGGQSFRFNHGAPALHANTPEFQRVIADWVEMGAARWLQEPRVIAGSPSTQTIPERLASGLDVRSSSSVVSIARADGCWDLRSQQYPDNSVRFDEYSDVVFACPPEQARRVLEASQLGIPEELAAVSSIPAWVCMLVIEKANENEMFPSSIRCDSAEGVASIHIQHQDKRRAALVVTMSDAWSMAQNGRTIEDAEPLIMKASLNALNRVASGLYQLRHVQFAQAHRWGLARPSSRIDMACLYSTALRMGFCGDWFAGPHGHWVDAEAAYLSGIAVAEQIAKHD
ncbi:MAG: FAD-dependent oxidoreductase [Phycisphaerales bacterium]